MFFKIYRILILRIFRLLPLLRCNFIKTIMLKSLNYKIGRNVKISSSVKIIGCLSLTIGENTFIGNETMLTGGKSSIIIGSNCDISSRVSIFTGTHQVDMINQRSAGEGISKDIIIGDGVWIGFGVIVLPGVNIGKKAVIGAGSIVTKDIPAYSIAVGNPCKVIKQYDEYLANH